MYFNDIEKKEIIKIRDKAQKIIDYFLTNIIKNNIRFIKGTEIFLLKELVSLSNNKININCIFDVLHNMANDKKKSLEDFENYYNNLFVKEKEYYKIYIPFEFNFFNKNKRNIDIFGREILFVSKNKVVKEFGKSFLNIPNLKSLLNNEVNIQKIPDNFIYFIGRKKVFDDSWNEIIPTFYIFKGIIEFILNFYTLSTYSHDLKIKAKYRHPNWFIFKDNNNKNFINKFLIQTKKYAYNKKFKISEEKYFNTIINILKKNNKQYNLVNIISNAFKLYSYSMDSFQLGECFLGLWQMAECLCLSNYFYGRTDKLIKRLKLFIEPKVENIDISTSINMLAYKRNNFVHDGNDNIDNFDINLIKILCERILVWIIKNFNKIKNKDTLNYYYEFLINTENMKTYQNKKVAFDLIKDKIK